MSRTLQLIPITALLFLPGCEESTAPDGPDPVGGGQNYVLDRDFYTQNVAPIIAQKGCDVDGDCHGGGIRGTFQLSPQSNKNVDYDFDQAILQVNGYDPTQSPLLTEPLDVTAGGTTHPLTSFADTNDADYQAILDWIEAGEFQ